MDFYERVKNLVKNKNLSLLPLLSSLGIEYEKYRGQKRFNNLPRADEAVKIAQALNTTVEYLVTGNKPDLSSETKSLINELEMTINKYKN